VPAQVLDAAGADRVGRSAQVDDLAGEGCVFDQRMWLCQLARDEVGGLIDHAVLDIAIRHVL
jgi:hypothetical protein